MYSTTYELPTQVQNSLDEEDCGKWMEIYNSCNPETEDEIEDAKKTAWMGVRTLPSSFSFDIIATVEDVDTDGELITLSTIRRQMDMFIRQGGVVQDEHGNYNIATIWGWDDFVEEESGLPGILVHGNVYGGRGENAEYATARQDFIDGKNSLSIAGDATMEGMECDETRCFVRRNLEQLMEISLCTIPANPHCKMVWYNENAIVKSKSDSDVSLKVRNVHTHKSYATCELERVRAVLRKIGFEASVHKDGCHVKAKPNSQFINKSLNAGLFFDYDINESEFIVKSMEHEMEKEFKDALRKGECRANGLLTGKVTKERFSRLYEHCMLTKTDKGWGFDASALSKEAGAFGAGSAGASNARYSGKRISFKEMMEGWRTADGDSEEGE